jgi:hypothetical protein
LLQLVAEQVERTQAGQRPAGVPLVVAQVLLRQGREQGEVVVGQPRLFAQHVGQGAVPLRRPGVVGGRELLAGEEVQLHGQQAEHQVAIGGRGAHRRTPQGEKTEERR